jgi:hypothetical protein
MVSAQTSQDLFNKIRSKFSNLQIGDNLGEVTANPQDAVFFDFEFNEDADTFGRVSLSLADGENLKVFYNKGLVDKIDEDDKSGWYGFLKELKDFAVTHQLGFDVRDITKNNLTQQDFKNLADQNQTVNIDGMSEELSRITKLAGLAESLTGTSKSSFENLDKTRLIIRHSKPVAEEVPGARTRHINSLYIENSEGERFKYPIVHLAGARAMARHVANGGLPHDEFGEHIVATSEQIAQLNSFNRYVSTKDQLNDSAGDIIERARMKCETLKKYIKGLSKQKHYEATKESFQPTDIPTLDDETKTQLQDKFTLKHFDEKIDSALPLLNSIMKEFDDEDKPLSKKDVEIPAPVDAAPLVQQYLADPENKLVLRQDPAADQMLARTNFTNKNTMLSSILGDIAARMLTKTPEQDRVANFASHVANEIAQEGEPFFEPHKNYIRDKKVAFQLAKRYIDDYKKMKQDPEYVSQVRMDPAAYEPKKDRQGQAKEEMAFEGWADNITEQKPYVSMYRGEDGKMVYDVLDKDGESAYVSSDYDTATAYLRKNFDTLAGRKPAMDDVNENPETDQEMSMDYEFTGDDGEMAYGTLHYKVVNGKVDPNSLRGESEYEGNAKVDDEFATQMVQPGGPEHEEALDAAQDDYDYEAQRMQSKFGEDAGENIAKMAQNMTKDEFMSHADELGLSPEEAAEHYEKMSGGAHANKFEGNEFALAVQKAKAAGMKPGDKFEVGGKEYTLKDAIEQAGLQLEEFFAEDELVEYKQKPDFLDLDKDGNKTEPMKSASKDAKLNVSKADKALNTPAYQKMKAGDPKYADKTNEVADILKLAGI